jgi:hypothetical protein
MSMMAMTMMPMAVLKGGSGSTETERFSVF